MPSDDILLRSKLKLGKQLLGEKRFDEARVVYEQICARKKNDADHWFTLGVINGILKRHADAVKYCSKAVDLAPSHTAAWYNLGIALRDNGQTEQAAIALRKTLELNPKHDIAATSLGHVLASLHQYDEAEKVFRNLLDYQSDNAEFLALYGSAMQSMGRFEAAINAYQKVIEIGHPHITDIQANLATSLCLQGKFEESIEIYDNVLRKEPNDARIYSSMLLTLQYANQNPASLLEHHRKWPGNQLPAATKQRSANRPQRLRIGYVSSDFRKHSVAYFIEPLLAHHDAKRFEITCYFNHKDTDSVTTRLKQITARWRNIADMDDSEVLRVIADDKIDILVDLNGHTAGNRLTIFARRAAPVQVSFIGYPDSTGVTQMDYRISDNIADPPSTVVFCSEKLIQLPNCFLCYQPPQHSPDVVNPPCEKNHFITFGSFNNLAKIGPDVIATWAELLQKLPNSRLVIKNPSLTDKMTRERYQVLFANAGIAKNRLDLLGYIADDGGHLGAYRLMDIALDTFPYNGTTTTCEALWMGVPVITLCGNRHSARVGTSLLKSIEHSEWIADSPQEYINIAQNLAQDLTLLTKIRTSLREQMKASRLCSAVDYAKSIECIYDDIFADKI